MNLSDEVGLRILESFGAQYVFCSPYVSEMLEDYDSFLQCSRTILKESMRELPDSFRVGFKLMLLVNLHAMVEELISNPGWFEIGPDSVLIQKSRWSDRSVDSYPVLTDHGRLVRNLVECKRRILTASTWKEIRIAHNSTNDYLKILSHYLEKGYECLLIDENRKRKLTLASLLRKLALSYIVMHLGDPKNIREAYWDLYHPSGRMTIKRVIDLQKEWARSPKEKDDYKMPLLRGKQDLDGYVSAFVYLVHSLIPKQSKATWKKLRSEIVKSSNLARFRRTTGELSKRVVMPLKEEWGFGHILENLSFQRTPFSSGSLQKRILKPLFKPSKESLSLNEKLMYRPVRLVQYENPISGAHFFSHVFHGLLYLVKRNNDKIPVIRFVHPDSPGNSYSYAILMPSYGTAFSDLSEWWLFYNSFTDYSVTAGDAYESVERLIGQNRNHVRLEEHEIEIGDSALMSALESRRVRLLRKTMMRLWEANQQTRGNFLELLVAYYFMRLGYNKVALRKPSPIIGGRHIDVAALKLNDDDIDLTVVECKGHLHVELESVLPEDLQSTPEEDLSQNLRDVIRFGQDVEKISKNASEYASQMFEIQGHVRNVHGKVISTTFIGNTISQYIPSNLEFWSWETFRKELRRVGIPREIYVPLEGLLLEEFDVTHGAEIIELETDSLSFE